MKNMKGHTYLFFSLVLISGLTISKTHAEDDHALPSTILELPTNGSDQVKLSSGIHTNDPLAVNKNVEDTPPHHADNAHAKTEGRNKTPSTTTTKSTTVKPTTTLATVAQPVETSTSTTTIKPTTELLITVAQPVETSTSHSTVKPTEPLASTSKPVESSTTTIKPIKPLAAAPKPVETSTTSPTTIKPTTEPLATTPQPVETTTIMATAKRIYSLAVVSQPVVHHNVNVVKVSFPLQIPVVNVETSIIDTSAESVDNNEPLSNSQPDGEDVVHSTEVASPEDFVPAGPNLFTVTNTDVGFTWEKLPYREKYQFETLRGPCRKFSLKVPEERADKSVLKLCIFRPYLEFVDDTELFIHYVGGSERTQEHKELTVHGYVTGYNESLVIGTIIDKYFYGEVTVIDPATREINVYVVEQIKILTKLMRHNEKILTNILYVMENGVTPSAKYNAVVTKGASLMSFMVAVNPTESKLGSFLVFSTKRNSYITAGEPEMDEDEKGEISFNAGGDKIVIDPVGTVNLITRSRKYIFRPHGKTIVREGTSVDTLQEHEGSVAVSAFTSQSAYGCILPTPALSKEKKGGFICKVCLAVDKLFRKHFKASGFNKGSPIRVLGRIIDRVSWIFRSTDWNNDGRTDNIGLDYDPQMQFWSYAGDDDVTGNEQVNQTDMETMLSTLSKKDFSDCCLGVAFTMKAFPGIAFGFSSQTGAGASAEKIIRGHTGVCGTKEDGVHHNLVLISANNKDGAYKPITEDQLVLVAAQEIGRVFGADSDGTGEEGCDDFTLGLNDTSNNNSTKKKSKKGHYLMWPEVLRKPDPEEKSFSPCSKKSILKTLTTCRSACFDIDKHPFCGNGIVEIGEECDCGSEYTCTLQKCCFSRLGKHPCRKTGITPCNLTTSAVDSASKNDTTESSAFLATHHLSPGLLHVLLWSFLTLSASHISYCLSS